MRRIILAAHTLLPGCWLMSSLFAQELPEMKGKFVNLPTPMRTATDPLRADPAQYSTENATGGMLALRLKLGPDEATGMAFFQDALFICLSECHVRLTLPNFTVLNAETSFPFPIKEKRPTYSGLQVVDVHMEAGTTRIIGAGMRSILNLSTSPVEMLIIERKDLAP